MEHTSPLNTTATANPRAIIVRIRHNNIAKTDGQNRHDVRTGRQPDYVDASRRGDNDVLIEPKSGAVLRQVCEERRAQRNLSRSAPANGAVSTAGLLGFGTIAQDWFAKLDRETQNRACREVAEAVAATMNTDLVGLAVHRDESAIHAHFELVAYERAGFPLSAATGRKELSKLQDVVAEAMSKFLPDIERGHRKLDRLAAGADYADTVNRSVRQLHADLPAEIAAKQAELADKQAKVDEMQMRVDKLLAKNELTAAEAKRLQIYQKRLEARISELSQFAQLNQARVASILESAKASVVDMDAKSAAKQEEATKFLENAKIDVCNVTLGIDLIADQSLWQQGPEKRWHIASHVAIEKKERLTPRILAWLSPVFAACQRLIANLREQLSAAEEDRRQLAQERAALSEMTQQLSQMHFELNEAQSKKLAAALDYLDGPDM